MLGQLQVPLELSQHLCNFDIQRGDLGLQSSASIAEGRVPYSESVGTAR